MKGSELMRRFREQREAERENKWSKPSELEGQELAVTGIQSIGEGSFKDKKGDPKPYGVFTVSRSNGAETEELEMVCSGYLFDCLYQYFSQEGEDLEPITGTLVKGKPWPEAAFSVWMIVDKSDVKAAQHGLEF